MAVAMSVSACGDPTTASTGLPQHEQDYLNAVYDAAQDKGSGIHGYGDEKNLDLGHRLCESLQAGAAPAEVARSVRSSNGDAVANVAPDIVANADRYLCRSD